MNTARRAALTATLATTAALSIAGVSWGIGTTVAGSATTSSDVPYTVTVDDTVAAGSGQRAGRGGAGQGAGAPRWYDAGRDGSGAGTGTADQFRAGRGGGYGRSAAGSGAESCTEDCTGAEGTGRYGRGRGSGGGPGMGGGTGSAGGAGSGDHSDIPAAVPGATVTDAVAQELRYLVEEEKLAGDVYALAESLYGDRIFSNIGRAEDHHADEVRVLLDRYDIEDPTTGAAAGEFIDPELQALYDRLASQVRTSRSDAIAAGILVEQTDIADLEELASAELPADVRAVVENLLAGSQRHLAALLRQAA